MPNKDKEVGPKVQKVYGRHMCLSPKAVNEILKKKSVMCKPAQAAQTAWEGGGVNQESPTKATAMHAVYCLRISCSPSDYVASQGYNSVLS